MGEKALGRWIAVFIVLVALALGLGAVARIVLRDEPRPVTTTIIAPPRTPLPDRVLDEKAKKKGAKQGSLPSAGAKESERAEPFVTRQPQARRSPQTPSRRETPRTTPKPRPTRPAPPQPPQTSNPPSPSPERDPVDIAAPLPTTVCIERVGGLNC